MFDDLNKEVILPVARTNDVIEGPWRRPSDNPVFSTSNFHLRARLTTSTFIVSSVLRDTAFVDVHMSVFYRRIDGSPLIHLSYGRNRSLLNKPTPALCHSVTRLKTRRTQELAISRGTLEANTTHHVSSS
jgi:hypothetical protein